MQGRVSNKALCSPITVCRAFDSFHPLAPTFVPTAEQRKYPGSNTIGVGNVDARARTGRELERSGEGGRDAGAEAAAPGGATKVSKKPDTRTYIPTLPRPFLFWRDWTTVVMVCDQYYSRLGTTVAAILVRVVDRFLGRAGGGVVYAMDREGI